MWLVLLHVVRHVTPLDTHVTARLRGLDERQALLLSGEQDLAERVASLRDRETKWKAREEWIARREGELKGLEAVLLARERKLRLAPSPPLNRAL